MSLFTPQFQIISDLHLETPVVRPQYSTFKLQIQANNLCLLGDIGLVKDAGFFHFLRRLLEEGRGYRIFYVIGNHESYQMAFEDAVNKLRSFEKEAERDYGGRFILLHRSRYDIDKRITVLGCTLWTAIDSSQASEVASRLTDFNEHRKDLSWLNDQVIEIQRTEPQREIVMLTHHCPTIKEKVIDPTHRGSLVSSGFTSDLPNEVCWIAPEVKVWAFGHTHYDCAFHDQQTGKLVSAHQKGYSQIGKMKKVTLKLNGISSNEVNV
ncbi:hypothetical protein BS50DRAFT_608460 [Corynespora cassiicola Philippines]|uniref:Calcineurin-like phosphoesterase domain-containing protein n=1 Tax=Corynespora cassiicola Philippines TaxID=1448308 RepID=A0A2T2NVY6_CORCC|nr:hypothetical protein BS50DRAFT_608460 [Corynespora cassiicola Philippines]